MAQLFRLMVTIAHFLVLQAQRLQPVQTELLPVCVPLQVRIRLTEEFQLHLLEFSCTEGKVTGWDLISERFSDLRDTKRKFLS